MVEETGLQFLRLLQFENLLWISFEAEILCRMGQAKTNAVSSIALSDSDDWYVAVPFAMEFKVRLGSTYS